MYLFGRRGPIKYKFQALYELDSLAVVNVRDAGHVKNAFKVLMFPDTRMYQAENPKAKVIIFHNYSNIIIFPWVTVCTLN